MKILFQGDSITDWYRNYDDPHDLGKGYPLYAAAFLKDRFPNENFEFIDLGISGNRSADLAARWQKDCIDLQPDIVSIMIGINDTWRRFDNNDPTSVETYEANLRSVLEQTRAKTNAKIVILEPYLLHDVPEKDTWREDLDAKIEACRRLAREFADVYVPTDGLLAAACIDHSPLHWSDDGVHPNANGATFIGRLYCDAVAKLLS